MTPGWPFFFLSRFASIRFHVSSFYLCVSSMARPSKKIMLQECLIRVGMNLNFTATLSFILFRLTKQSSKGYGFKKLR